MDALVLASHHMVDRTERAVDYSTHLECGDNTLLRLVCIFDWRRIRSMHVRNSVADAVIFTL